MEQQKSTAFWKSWKSSCKQKSDSHQSFNQKLTEPAIFFDIGILHCAKRDHGFCFSLLCLFILFHDVNVSCVLDRLSLHRNRMNDNHEKVWIFVWSIGMSQTLRGLFYNHIDIYLSNDRDRNRVNWRKKLNEMLQYLRPIYPEGIPTSTKKYEMYFVSHVKHFIFV